jgi:hypothetical protein
VFGLNALNGRVPMPDDRSARAGFRGRACQLLERSDPPLNLFLFFFSIVPKRARKVTLSALIFLFLSLSLARLHCM